MTHPLRFYSSFLFYKLMIFGHESDLRYMCYRISSNKTMVLNKTGLTLFLADLSLPSLLSLPH